MLGGGEHGGEGVNEDGGGEERGGVILGVVNE